MTAARIAQRALELDAIMAAPMTDLDRVDAMDRIGELRREIDGLGAHLAGRLATATVTHGEAPLVRAQAYRSTADLIEAHVGLDPREAQAWCRVGGALQPRVSLVGEVLPDGHPAVSGGVRSARLSIASADLILSTLESIEPFSTFDERSAVETLLVDSSAGLSARQFAMLGRGVINRFNPDGAEPREDLLRERSGLRVTRTREGLVRWTLMMHPEAAGFLTAAVDARTAPRRQPRFVDPAEELEAPPDGAADRRPLEQVRLDALVSIARESLAADTGRLAGAPVTMLVTVPLEILRSGIGTAEIAGIDEPICASTARRLAADAEIIPIVLGGPSEPLDQGRAVRLATEPQRRALAFRDEGCIWTGCSAPPAWCEVAHIVPWFSGGCTDLDNMMLLCPFHHRRFDRDGWELEIRDGERWLIPPAWVARAPRRAGPVRQRHAA